MRFGPVFRTHGEWIYLVDETIGALDLETGTRPKTYRYERVQALIGKKNFGLQMHLHIDESMIVLPKEADLVVVSDQAYKLTLVSSAYGLYIYTKDKVKGDEFRSIVGGIPSKSGDEVFL